MVEAPFGLAAIYDQAPSELLTLSGERLVTTAAAAPLTPLAAAYAVIAGDENLLREVVADATGAPLWVMDPALEALAQILPGELGGGTGQESTDGVDDGALLQFRNTVLIDLRDDAGDLAEGAALTLQRLVRGLALAPLGVVPVAEGALTSISGGPNTALYLALREYIDAPQWIADPAIEGAARVLPAPVGGTNGEPTDPTGDGQLMQFRNNVLIGARDSVRSTVADTLGVHPDTGAPISTATMQSRSSLLPSASDNDAAARKGESAAPKRTTPATSLTRPDRRLDAKAPVKRLERLVKRVTGANRAPEAGSAD
ncbi:hypothetical protein A5727_15615 [Mycobacterium sp. ACS4331]|nr:hypothetical protein A5727_15615 [Mycobacterium sp. ACS4331]